MNYSKFAVIMTIYKLLLLFLSVNLITSKEITKKNVEFDFKGLMAPVFTPFNNDSNKSLNLEVIPEYATFLTTKQISGVLVGGTTGEGTLLSVNERKELTEAWAKASKMNNLHLMVHVGGVSPTDVKELAAHAERLKVDSILCLPDLYFKPANTEDLIQYLGEISEAAPNTPLLYYQSTKVPVKINIKDLLLLGTNQIKTLVGVKIDSSDIKDGLEALSANYNQSRKNSVIYGSKMVISAACTIGIETFMSATFNFCPEIAWDIMEFCEGRKSLKDGKMDQNKFNTVERDILLHGGYVETMKAAMSLASGIYMGPTRSPLKTLSYPKIIAIAKGLKSNNIEIDESILQAYRFSSLQDQNLKPLSIDVIANRTATVLL